MTTEISFLKSALAKYANTKGFISKAVRFKDAATFQIKGDTTEAVIESLSARFNLKAAQKETLLTLAKTDAGEAFILRKVNSMNREAFHRSAFLMNAALHATFVNLVPWKIYLNVPEVKLAFTVANLGLAAYAHHQLRRELKALVAGPQALPPKRWMGGLLRNRAYNRAVKRSSQPYANTAWRETRLYRPAYFINGTAMLLGGEFLLAGDRLMWPASFVVNKATSLVTMAGTGVNYWRGVKSADDALKARQFENEADRKLQL